MAPADDGPPDDGPVEIPDERSVGRRRSEVPAQPGGLLGLLLWPLRVVLGLGLQVFAAFVQGVLRAFLPARRGDDDAPPSR